MAGPVVQFLPVADVGVGPGPFPSGWVLGSFQDLGRVGLPPSALEGDFVAVLCAAVDTDPADQTNPNVLGYFYGGPLAGMKAADVLHATACVYYATLRYLVGDGSLTTAGLIVQMEGT